MAKQPAPSGYVFYEGPSMLTGAPIVAIATMAFGQFEDREHDTAQGRA